MSDSCIIQGVQNHDWKPNGPGSYAKSARRWNIQHSDSSTFFVQNNRLMRRGVSEEEDDEDDEYSPTAMLHAASNQNAARGALMHKNNVQVMSDAKTGHVGQQRKVNNSKAVANVQAKDVQNDSEYIVPVTIGTPGIKLNLDFDTGSSDLWVWSSKIKSDDKKRKIYHPSQSQTAKKANGLSWKIQYADSSTASGDVYFDRVSLQGIHVKNQAVEVATQLSGSFLDDSRSDGLLGLAWPKINTVKPQPQKTPVQQMIEQKLIDKPIFTVKLDKGDSAGFFTFGSVAGNVLPRGVDIWTTYVNPSNGWWEFDSRGIMIGKKEFPRPPGNTAIADTGTTLILLDDNTVKAIYSSIRGATLDHNAGGYIIPSDSTPPDIYFACGERYFGIPGDDLKFSPSSYKGYMFGAIQSRGSNKQDILGDVFLKRVYALFDARADGPRIGFGQREFY